MKIAVKTKTENSTMVMNIGFFKLRYAVFRPDFYNVKTKKTTDIITKRYNSFFETYH